MLNWFASVARFVLWALFFGLLPGRMQAVEQHVAGRPPPGLYCNIDDSTFFWNRDIPDGKAGALIDQYIDVMAGSGTTVLVCCVNARRTNYRSKVWDAYWDGFDPNGPDDQPFLAPVPRDAVASYRKWVSNTQKVFAQGVDYPARMLARCRHDGLSPWISVRMNDCHLNDILNHPFHGSFWVKNPQFFRKNCSGYFAHCLDYAHPEVRAYFQALLQEVLDRYDMDGLELDFMREAYCFSGGQEAAGKPILTAWMRKIHALVQDAATKRGHPIHLGVRVPSHPETALGLGFDAITWAREGLIDMLVVTPRWATLEFDMPLERWRSLLGPAQVTLAGGLEILYRPCPNGPATPASPELAKGAATAIFSRGADALYLFNYFQDSDPHAQWPVPLYQKTLTTMSSLQTLTRESRTFGITYRDVTAPDEIYHAPLPAQGKEIVLPMRIGPLPSAQGRCEVSVEFAPLNGKPLSNAAISVNGKTGAVCRDVNRDNGKRLLTVFVPQTSLQGMPVHQIKITAQDASASYRVERVELAIEEPK